jgi:hypothetical protein
MKDSTRKALQAHVTTIRQHLAATEQAVALDSLPDVLLCIADLMDEVGKAGDLAKAETQGD